MPRPTLICFVAPDTEECWRAGAHTSESRGFSYCSTVPQWATTPIFYVFFGTALLEFDPRTDERWDRMRGRANQTNKRANGQKFPSPPHGVLFIIGKRRWSFMFIPLVGSNITKKSLKFINKSLYAATKSLDLINWPLDPLTLPLSQKGGP